MKPLACAAKQRTSLTRTGDWRSILLSICNALRVAKRNLARALGYRGVCRVAALIWPTPIVDARILRDRPANSGLGGRLRIARVVRVSSEHADWLSDRADTASRTLAASWRRALSLVVGLAVGI